MNCTVDPEDNTAVCNACLFGYYLNDGACQECP